MGEVRVDSANGDDSELVIVDYDLIASCGEGVIAICKVCYEWISSNSNSFNEFVGLINNHTELKHGTPASS